MHIYHTRIDYVLNRCYELCYLVNLLQCGPIDQKKKIPKGRKICCENIPDKFPIIYFFLLGIFLSHNHYLNMLPQNNNNNKNKTVSPLIIPKPRIQSVSD
jgi:hypothetical protein